MRRSLAATCRYVASKVQSMGTAVTAAALSSSSSTAGSSTGASSSAARSAATQGLEGAQQALRRSALGGGSSSGSSSAAGARASASGSGSSSSASGSGRSVFSHQHQTHLLYFLCGSGVTAATCLAYGAMQGGGNAFQAVLDSSSGSFSSSSRRRSKDTPDLWERAARLPAALRESLEERQLPEQLRVLLQPLSNSVSGSGGLTSPLPSLCGGGGSSSSSSVDDDGAPTWGPYAIADAAARAAPAVVNIIVPAPDSGYPYHVASTGSGFIFDADGRILTNAHVVAEAVPKSMHGSMGSYSSASSTSDAANPSNGSHGVNGSSGGGSSGGGLGPSGFARPLQVTLPDGRTYAGRVLSCDRVTDLAVVKVEAEEPLPVVKLGSSGSLRVGEWVVALGSPLHLQNSVTAGIVSCVDRKAVELGLADARTEYIQTDAAINRGNSGGPLVNLRGEVIGISNMKAIAADGVSFAIPVDTAKEVVSQLSQCGRVVRPYIGIKMLQLSRGNARQFAERDPGFPRGLRHGILVPHVYPGSPAEKAGLKKGDVIVGFTAVGGGSANGGGSGGSGGVNGGSVDAPPASSSSSGGTGGGSSGSGAVAAAAGAAAAGTGAAAAAGAAAGAAAAGGGVTTGSLIRHLARHVGKPLQLVVRRGGDTLTIEVVASEATS